MKKILFSLLAIFFIVGITTVNACETCGCKNKTADQEVVEANEDAPKCAKTGKVCPSTCPKKATGNCCEGKKTTQNNSGFNFNKSNSYGNTGSTCSKSAQKTCSKSAQKTCSKSGKKCCSKSGKKCCSKVEKEAGKECDDSCTKACCA